MASVEIDAGGCTLTIAESAPILADCHVGDSIAVNGACLTVTEFHKEAQGGWFQVWLANETLDRTDLGMFSLHCCSVLAVVQGHHACKERGRLESKSTWSGRWVPMFDSEDTSCRCASMYGWKLHADSLRRRMSIPRPPLSSAYQMANPCVCSSCFPSLRLKDHRSCLISYRRATSLLTGHPSPLLKSTTGSVPSESCSSSIRNRRLR